MTLERFNQLFPNASKAFIKLNVGGDDPREVALRPDPRPAQARPQTQDPVAQQNSRTFVVAKVRTEGCDTERFSVRIESRRLKFIDPDNLVGGCKYVVDACRQCGAIPDDSPQSIELEVLQSKAASKEEECTILTIIPPHLRT